MKLRDDAELIAPGLIEFKTAGNPHRSDYTFWRGENTTFHPTDEDMASVGALDIIAKGLPAQPLINNKSNIIAFGSCFADNVSKHLYRNGYRVATRDDPVAYISRMGDGIVNSYAVAQQFEWAWTGKTPQVELWHGYDAKALGYDEDIRLATKATLDKADVFIITLGLSEVWYDEPTGEIFWRAVPADKFDPERHKFRVVSQYENRENLFRVRALIREHRPDAHLIWTLSPIPLTATFRPVSCMWANAVSKANLRSALDEAVKYGELGSKVHYYPSYEIVRECFRNSYMEDRRHIHRHIIDFIMTLFERHYCGANVDVEGAYRAARELDARVAARGHWEVPRSNIKYSKPINK